jgi:hypothetical protein
MHAVHYLVAGHCLYRRAFLSPRRLAEIAVSVVDYHENRQGA